MSDSYKDLLRHVGELHAPKVVPKSVLNREKFNQLLVWIESNFDEEIDVPKLLEVSGLTVLELNSQFIVNTKLYPLQWIKAFREYKGSIDLQSQQPLVDNTYALFDPSKP